MAGRNITELIPQRDPILMVDKLLDVTDETAVTCLTVRANNFFMDEDGCLAEAGVVEHIAQSASALAGYKALAGGALNPPVGYIGEVKKFCCYRPPRIGEVLQTTVALDVEVGGIILLTGETCIGDEVVAHTQMKISIE